MIRVLVVDDNPVIRSGVRSLLEADPEIEVVAEASDGQEAIARAREHRPDVVLLDVRMPVMDGVAAAEPLSRDAKVMMLTYGEDTEMVAGAIRAGAAGYLVHGRFSPEDLVRAVRDLNQGRQVLSPAVVPKVFEAMREGGPQAEREGPSELTEREREVMNLLVQGLSNPDIAGRLFISEKTVKNHINRIYAKLGVSDRAKAIAVWLGTLGPDPTPPHGGP
ncbi:MAG: response regulator [Actinomycetota bacterium]